MSNLREIKSQWLLELEASEKALLYQPKVKPSDELSLLGRIFTSYRINKAFYTKISVNVNGEIMDFHLVALETKSSFVFDNLLPDLISHQKELEGFKFLDLSTNGALAKQIKKGEGFYKK